MAGTSPRRPRGRRVVAALVVAALVVALTAGVVLVHDHHDASASPALPNPSPTLHLSRTTTGGTAAELAAAAGSTTGSGGWQLGATLPAGPSQGVVVDTSTSTVTEAQVRALLRALGMGTATPHRVDGGWTAHAVVHAEPAAFALDERAGNVWQYARGAQAGCLVVNPGAAPSAAASCSVTSTPAPAAPAAPGRSALLAAAAGVFHLVGVTPGTGLAVHDGEGVAYLDVPLTVEGLPVVGVDLSVGADRDGLVSALGWLRPTFTTVGQYPLVTADAAFARLAAEPVPEPAIACASGRSCPSPTPQVVTNARLAWLTSRDDDRTVLVPAWQFEVGGYYDPAAVAVEPSYLSTPSPTPTAAATDPQTGAGSGP